MNKSGLDILSSQEKIDACLERVKSTSYCSG